MKAEEVGGDHGCKIADIEAGRVVSNSDFITVYLPFSPVIRPAHRVLHEATVVANREPLLLTLQHLELSSAYNSVWSPLARVLVS